MLRTLKYLECNSPKPSPPAILHQGGSQPYLVHLALEHVFEVGFDDRLQLRPSLANKRSQRLRQTDQVHLLTESGGAVMVMVMVIVLEMVMVMIKIAMG